MKNADKPAYPYTAKGKDESGTFILQAHGLTKREKIAAMAMQGILGKQSGQGDQLGDLTNQNMGKIADASVKFAESLLQRLEETE